MLCASLQYLQLSEEDVQLLLLYQTQTVLTEHFSRQVRVYYLCYSTWSDFTTSVFVCVQVNVEEVSSVDAQKTLFDTLLGESVSLDQLLALASLLEAWSGSGWVDWMLTLANIIHWSSLQSSSHQ